VTADQSETAQSDSAQARGARNEAAVRHFLDGLHDLTMPDLSAALEPFADDATYQSLVPRRAPIQGKAAIRAELEQQFTRYQECVCEIVAIASNGREYWDALDIAAQLGLTADEMKRLHGIVD
jgi:hypothetical protein